MFFPNFDQFTNVVVLGVCACMYGRNHGGIWLIHGIFCVPWYCDVGSSADECIGAVAGCVEMGFVSIVSFLCICSIFHGGLL